MKTIRIIAQFYIGNVIPTLLVTVILFFSIYNMISCIGIYQYLNFSEQTFQYSGLENAVYFMPHLTDKQTEEAYLAQKKDFFELIHQLEENALVKQVLSFQFNSMDYQGKVANCVLYHNNFERAFPMNLQEGTFSPQNFNEDYNTINAVVGGYVFNRVSVGDTLSLRAWDKDRKEITINIHVTGKMRNPAFVPDFGSSGMFYADDLYTERDNTIFVSQSEFQQKFGGKLEPAFSSNYFIDFLQPLENPAVVTLLEQYSPFGTYKTYSQILEDTREKNAYQEKKLLPVPLFFTLITTIALLSVSILLVEKKRKEHSVYYLCGCSKKRSYLYMAASVGIPVLLAGGVNLGIIWQYPFLSQHGYVDFGKVIIDQGCAYPVILYMVAACLLSTILPYLVYRKKSPIDLYRRKN